MLLCHLNDNHPDFHEKTPDISNLNKFYKEAKKRFDDEPDFKGKAFAPYRCGTRGLY
jgi:arginyl-tRNA synthetase